MTISLPVGLRGSQQPRLSSVPDAPTSAGQEAIDLAASAGLALDPWQQFTLDMSLRENADGLWAAYEVLLIVARQNGKGGIIEARELAGLYLFKERRIIYSAHQFETALDAFGRLLDLIEDTPHLDRLVKKVSRSHGEEGLELKNKSKIKFKTRTKRGGRGLTGDTVFLDESMELPAAAHGVLMPTLSARPNPQLWYVGSAVDKEVHEHGLVMTRIRNRGLAGDDPKLCYVEWSCPPKQEPVPGEPAERAPDTDPTDPANWAVANPGLGIRISPEWIATEQRSMPAKQFAVEILGIGDWPEEIDEVERLMDPDLWQWLSDPAPTLTNWLCLGVDMSRDRRWCSIGAATLRQAGGEHLELIRHVAGSAGVVAFLVEVIKKWDPCAVVLDKSGPAASLIPDLRKVGIEPETTSAAQMAQACGDIVDGVAQGLVTNSGDPLLLDAVKALEKRNLGDAFAFARQTGGAVISPLVSVTLARWGLKTFALDKTPPPPPTWDQTTAAGEAGGWTADLMDAHF